MSSDPGRDRGDIINATRRRPGAVLLLAVVIFARDPLGYLSDPSRALQTLGSPADFVEFPLFFFQLTLQPFSDRT